MRTSELIGPALDYAVAKCEGLIAGTYCYKTPGDGYVYCEGSMPVGVISASESAFDICINDLGYSTDWSQGGPIIERERIGLEFMDNFEAWSSSIVREDGQDRESYSDDQDRESYTVEQESFVGYGPTPLIAAMRCYVASKLGDEIAVPEELTCQ